jgi:hypothetical protein
MAMRNVSLRITDEERKAWNAAATADGRTLGNWVRKMCNGQLGRAMVETLVEPERSDEFEEQAEKPRVRGGRGRKVAESGRCAHGKAKGEICYRCDKYMGRPEIK